jgi:hypothetical protein
MSMGRNIRITGLLVIVVSMGTAWPQDSGSKKDIYKAAETAANDGKTEESQKLYCQVAKLDPTFKDAKMLCKVMTEEIDRERKKNDERFKLGVQRFNETKYDEAQHEFANIKWGPHYVEAQLYLTVRIPQARQNQKQPLSTTITTSVALSTSAIDAAAEQEWQEAKEAGNARDLQAFINKHPNSPHVGEATERIQQLRTASDRDTVLKALRSYAAAYEHKDVNELAAVWPALNRKKISETFKNASSIKMDLKPLGDPSISGDTATVKCERTLLYAASGTKNTFSDQITIRLQWRSSSWLIESIN